jgi:hypothetical protein
LTAPRGGDRSVSDRKERNEMEPMNREQRRHPEKLQDSQADIAAGQGNTVPAPNPDEQMRGDDRMPDDLSTRAKNTGHGKKTADKWNQ